MTFTPQINKRTSLEEAAAALREGYVDPQEAAAQAQTLPPDPAPAPPAEPAEDVSVQVTPGPDASTEGDQAQPKVDTPPAGDPPKDYATLEREHLALQKQFKALQGAITPTQQERSELRRQVTALTTEIQELKSRMTASGSGDVAPSGKSQPLHELKPKIDAVREVMPEVADLFESALAENQRLKGEITQRLDANDNQRHEDAKVKAKNRILSQRPNAFEIVNSVPFQQWKGSLGLETAETFDTVLANSFVNGDAGVDATLAILDAFYADTGGTTLPIQPAQIPMGTPLPPASRPAQAPIPPQAAPAPATPRPTDIGVPTRQTTRPTSAGASPVLSDSQVEEAERKALRGGNQKAALDLVEKMRVSMRASSNR